MHSIHVTGIIDALTKVAKYEKLSGLYKGIGPTLMAIAPFVAVQQITYDLLKYKAEVTHFKPSVMLFLFSGSLAGVTAQTVSTCYSQHNNIMMANLCDEDHLLLHMQVVFPLEVVRRRMQVARAPEFCRARSSVLSSLKRLSYKELFGGLSATYMKVIPAASISLLTRDALLGRLNED